MYNRGPYNCKNPGTPFLVTIDRPFVTTGVKTNQNKDSFALFAREKKNIEREKEREREKK
jgi:hypothetical protein